MARISGVNIPTGKRVLIALTYIYGIGPKIATDICNEASVDKSKRVNQLSDDQVNKIREIIEKKYSVEGDLRRKIPVRGQRTHTNARTRKGKAIAIAGKKKVTKG